MHILANHMDGNRILYTSISVCMCVCVCVFVYLNLMPEKKYCVYEQTKRIAFGPEIYIIHWDYPTLEYDDVTTRSLARISIHILPIPWHAFARTLTLAFLYLFVLQHKCHWHRLYVPNTHIIVCVSGGMICSVIVYCCVCVCVCECWAFSWYLILSL